jgi:hypothetical protein
MAYRRYKIRTESAPNLAGHPNRFQVRVNRIGLAKLLLREIAHTRGDWEVVTSRPCMYGVFSGPIGGFAPRPQHCVGCLRCTMQYPEFVEIRPNPARRKLGDSYFTPDKVDTVIYEATAGRVPVRGAGYGGAFGGPEWDGMWTDMSEIVRPTRDGIHGREFISTSVDIGSKPPFLHFDSDGNLATHEARWVSLPIPYLLELPLMEPRLAGVLQSAAAELGTRLILPLEQALDLELDGEALAPVLDPAEAGRLDNLSTFPDLIALTAWDAAVVERLRARNPRLVVGMCAPFGRLDMVSVAERGADFIYLVADYHGQTDDGFILDAIRRAHGELVEAGLRERMTLLGSGGIAAAEHVPKAIICGLDAVVLETPLLIALQCQFRGELRDRETVEVSLPPFSADWGCQRVINLIGSWRDQLLEILGAMGLREVRRLRGEIGRAMFMLDLELETFAEIDGFGG